jgi:hypothetical protein
MSAIVRERVVITPGNAVLACIVSPLPTDSLGARF